jgi:hypothetical protein
MKTSVLFVIVGLVAAGLATGVNVLLNERLGKAPSPKLEEQRSREDPVSADPIVLEHRIVVHDVAPGASVQPNPRDRTSDHDLPPSEPTNVAADIEALFQNDRNSRDATAKSESVVRKVFDDPQLKGVKLDRVECKATTCRVEMTFDSSQADNDGLRKILLSPDPDGIQSLHMSAVVPVRNQLSDGRVSATMYLYPPVESPPQQTLQ